MVNINEMWGKTYRTSGCLDGIQIFIEVLSIAHAATVRAPRHRMGHIVIKITAIPYSHT